VNRLVTPSGPAGALLNSQRVVGSSDQNLASAYLLEMAFHAEVRVPNGQHLRVDRSMSGVTDGASLAQGFVFEHVKTALGGMAAEAAFVFRKLRGAATDVKGSLVRRMALSATHFSLGHGMVTREIELAAHISVALEANRFGCSSYRDRETRPITDCGWAS